MAARADAPPEAVPGDLLDPAASQLEFNVRVLAVAEDERTPLLERLRYLAIVSANLDELYMGGADEVPAGRAEEILARQRACIERCLAELAARGHRIRDWAALEPNEREVLRTRLPPRVLPGAHPSRHHDESRASFSRSSRRSRSSMAVALQGEDTGPLHFAYLRLPSALPRFVELPEGGDLVPIEEIVIANLGDALPGTSGRGGRSLPRHPRRRSRARGGRRGRPASGDRGRARSAHGQPGRAAGAAAGDLRRAPLDADAGAPVRDRPRRRPRGGARDARDRRPHGPGRSPPSGLACRCRAASSRRSPAAIPSAPTRHPGRASATATCCSTIPMTTSAPPCCGCCSRPRRIPRWWPSR